MSLFRTLILYFTIIFLGEKVLMELPLFQSLEKQKDHQEMNYNPDVTLLSAAPPCSILNISFILAHNSLTA